MRSIGKIGLGALIAMATIALAGGASASAETSTQLCDSHTELICPEGDATTSVHMTLASGTVGKLLSSLTTVLCLGVLVESSGEDVGASGNPQQLDATALSFTGCGTTSTHSNCTVTVEEKPDNTLLKLGLDEGSLEALNGSTRLTGCGLGLNCLYDATGLLFSVGAQHLTAEETAITELGGEFLCPEEGELDGLLETLEPTYVSGEDPDPVTVLCKTHNSEKCLEKDRVKSLHMATTKPSVLYNTVANIECESSLATAKVLGPAEPQKIDLTELIWKDCHTQGAAENCTVTSESLPTLDLEQTALNLGTATTLGLEVGIECTVLGLFELDCVYGDDVSLPVEGALHKEGTGHGMLTASKVELGLFEGEGHCPEYVKWDALYELGEHAYILQ